MLYAYLFAAVAGAVLMAVSLFGGHGEHDADGDGLADADAGDGHAGGDGAHAHHGALDAVGALLSLRVWTYLLMFGGLSGLALRYLARLAEPWAGLTALASGLGAALLSRAMIRSASEKSGSAPLQTGALVGRSATVLVPFESGTTGKVRVQVNNATVDVLATTDDASLGARDEVLIVEVRDGSTAHVTRSPTGRG